MLRTPVSYSRAKYKHNTSNLNTEDTIPRVNKLKLVVFLLNNRSYMFINRLQRVL